MSQLLQHAHQDGFSIQKGGMVAGWFRFTSGSLFEVLAGKSANTTPDETGDEWTLRVNKTDSHKLQFQINGVGFSTGVTSDAGGLDATSAPNFDFGAGGVDCAGNIFVYLNGVFKSVDFSGEGPAVDPQLGTPLTFFGVENASPTEVVMDEWGIWACAKSKATLDFIYNNGDGRIHPFGDCCCDDKAHTDPRSIDRYSYDEIVPGETATIGNRRTMILMDKLIIDGSLEVDGTLIMET